MNPLGQNFLQRELKSMSEIAYTSIMESNKVQAHCFQHPPFLQMADSDMEYIIQVGNR